MEMTRIFGTVAVLLIMAYVANRLSRLTRVPDLIVLLLIGVTLGPILHWVRPGTFQGAIDILGTLALILILFAGGVELRLRQAARYAPAALLLMVFSYGLSLGLIALMGCISSGATACFCEQPWDVPASLLSFPPWNRFLLLHRSRSP